MVDCIKRFFDFYVERDFISAVSEIFPFPDFSYDNLQSEDPDLLHQLINFVDASIFGSLTEVKIQNYVVRDFIINNPERLKSYQKALELLKLEERYLKCITHEPSFDQDVVPDYFIQMREIEKDEGVLGNQEKERLLASIPQSMHSLIKFHLKIKSGWQKFKTVKPFYLKNFFKEFLDLHPWYPVRYELSIPSLENCPLDQIPIIFFEPIHNDLAGFLHQLEGRVAIFAFSTLKDFFQMFQFSAFVEALTDEHLIYILELYPNQQLASQNCDLFKKKDLFPIFFDGRRLLKERVFFLCQALKACLEQSKEEMEIDTPDGNWAYEIAKRYLFAFHQERLGIYRLPALHLQQSQMHWYDPHKGVVPRDKPLGPLAVDKMTVLLTKLSNQRLPRKPTRKEKMIMAHVVPQIVSGGHAPTRLLENLVMNHDPEKFEVIVISTEILREFPLEYPYNFYTSKASEQRGTFPLQQFQKIGIQAFLSQQSAYYLTNAFDLKRLLSNQNVDVAVFHGPDIVNTMTAQTTDVPLRVFLEHGSQPSYSGFDLAILSSYEAVEIYREHYEKIGTKAVALPFSVDVRKGWLPEPYTRKELGLPENALIMTTISTKLDVRLTTEFCHTVAQILERVPSAYYAPIGSIKEPERIQKIFRTHGVENRFVPLGMAKGSASQYARNMQLYLNEFPSGGCLALLDAMAAGCPIVTMYDASGDQQARYGGDFMGLDHSINSLKKEEYIELACQLLMDANLHQKWSQQALRQYTKFSDVKGYVKSFEKIILDSIQRLWPL